MDVVAKREAQRTQSSFKVDLYMCGPSGSLSPVSGRAPSELPSCTPSLRHGRHQDEVGGRPSGSGCDPRSGLLSSPIEQETELRRIDDVSTCCRAVLSCHATGPATRAKANGQR